MSSGMRLLQIRLLPLLAVAATATALTTVLDPRGFPLLPSSPTAEVVVGNEYLTGGNVGGLAAVLVHVVRQMTLVRLKLCLSSFDFDQHIVPCLCTIPSPVYDHFQALLTATLQK